MSDFKARISAELDTSKVEQQIKNLNGKKIKFTVDTGNTQKDIQSVNQSINTATKSTKSFGTSLKKSLNLGSAFALTSKGLQLISNAADKATDAVKEFDSAITDLRMATGDSYSVVSKLVKGYNALGKTIGATTTEVSASADSWLRQGHSIADTNTLIKDSMILSKVANIESAEATQYLTSAMKGYKVEVENVIGIVDKLTSIDLVSATDAAGLAEAMSKTAVSANLAGVSMDKLLGYLAATGEVTQDSMSVIGNAFKTFFARYSAIKTGKLEFVDEDGTTEILSDVEQSLKNVGIDMRSTITEFDNAGDVLDNLSEKWNTFSTVQKSAIASAFGGTRQKERFLVLMENYSTATNYMETAMNSTGTAQTKFAAYLDSIEAKTKSLQASFESLSVNTISTELIGGIIDATTAIVTFLDKTNLLKGTLVGLGTTGIIKGFTMLAAGISNASIKLNDFNSALKLVKAGNIGENEIQSLAKMTANLSQSQLKAVISSKALSTEQRIAILTAQGMSNAEAKAALSSMGLATAEGTATASTSTLTGALKGLWATLKANPLILVATAITGVFITFSKLSQSAEEAARKSKETADASKQVADSSKEELNTISELIKKYKELAKSDNQDTSTRKEIADIQSQIVDLVGEQASEIDLVNGKLSEQLDILYEIQGIELGNTISNYEKAYKDAKTATEKYDRFNANWTYDLASSPFEDSEITFDFWGENDKRNKGLDIIDEVWREKGYGTAFTEYQDYVLGEDSFGVLSFDEDLTYPQWIEALDAAIDALKNDANYDYSNSKLWDKLVEIRDELGGSDGYVTKQVAAANDLLEVLTQQYGKPDESIDSLDDYIAYRDEVINSVLGNDVISSAIKDGMLSNDSVEAYIDSYLGRISEIEDYYTKWVQSSRLQDIKDAFLKNLQDNNISANPALSMTDQFTKWVDSLSDEDKEIMYRISCNTDTAQFSLEDWQNALENYIAFLNPTTSEIESDLSDVITQYDKFVSSTAKATEILSSQSTGKSLSFEDFNSEELKDYTSALEYNNGVLQLNGDKVNEIIKVKSEEQIAINDSNKALAQSKYLENAAEVEKLRRQIKEKNYAEGESEQSIQDNIDALLSENSILKKTCDSYDLMSASLKEATGAYQKWLDAQNGSDYGDMFDDTLGAYQRIMDTYNSKSDIFGDFGSKKFDAAVDLWIPDSVDHEDTEAIKEYMKKIKSYLTFSDDGTAEGMNIAKFCKDAVKAGLMVFDKESNSYQVAGSKTMEDFAEGLDLSMPMVQAFFDEMQLKGGEFSWADEANKTIGDLAVSATEAAESLRGIEGNEDFAIRLDVSDIESDYDKVLAFENTIDEMNKIKAKPNVDPSEVEYANEVIRYCIAQQQQIASPIVMSVDTSALSGEQAEAIEAIQAFKKACNNLELTQALGLDTTEAQRKVDELKSTITSSDNQYLLALNLDTTSIDTLKSSIQSITGQQLNVDLGIDDSAIIGYTAEQKESTVVYKIDTSAVDAYNPKNLTRLVTYHIKTVGSVNTSKLIGGTHGLNGTAHISGTAYANGNWGATRGGEALTGELGREIVVDPHTGRWYTVGDNGAEFVDVPKGAIVFNHKQTESLLSNGYVHGRGSALVSGTAFVTGGINADYVDGSSSSSSGTKGNTKKSSSKKSSSKNSSSNKDELKKIDWAEVAIDRIERAIKRLETTATSAYKTLKKRLGATYDEISKVNQEIALQEKAYTRYMQEANSVGLSSSLATKVQNGTIDINEYGESTRELISEYQDWYEKALNCSDAVQELHENLAELYEDNFNNIQSDFENQLSLLEHLENTYNNGIDALEAKGYLESTKYYASLQDLEKQNISVLKQELESLTQSFSEAMASGEIDKSSESWHEMQLEIDNVKEKLQEANTSLLEYAQTMREIEWGHFDYIQERISRITAESDFLIDLMSNSDLYTDKGQFSDLGTATMGLHSMNYNVYMAQAEQYAEEMQEIEKQLAEDPYNTKLIERKEELLELQQDSILAAEDEKQAIVDLVEEGINLELDALQELIDKYSDALDSAKDLYDYQNKISDHTSEISTLQKQLSAYEGDTSEETKAKIQQLKVDLKSAEKDLEETEYEQYISDQKKLLDELYLEYETILNQRLDSVEILIQDMITSANTNTDSINATLIETGNNVGYTMTETMQSIWNGSTDALNGTLSVYGDGFNEQLTAINIVLGRIQANTAMLAGISDEEAEDVTTSATTTTAPIIPETPEVTTPSSPSVVEPTTSGDISVGGKINAKGAKIYDYAGDTSGEKQTYANDPIYTVIGESKGYLKVRWHKLSSGVSGWFKKNDVKAYKTGGLVDYTGLAWVDGTKSKPESMLDAQDTENLIKLRELLRRMANQELTIGTPSPYMNSLSKNMNSITPQLHSIELTSDKMSQIKSSPFPQNQTVTFGDTNIYIDHVQDYNDFVNQLRDDSKFEKMIQSMTVDQLAGKSSLAKNKYKW